MTHVERLDAFMARANARYYATHDPFADFTTAPEISQVFGELLGAWAAVTWAAMGRPAPVALLEFGPGRGTLMADALRAVRAVAPDFAAALHLHLVESSPRLRALQAQRLTATWHDRLETVPAMPTIAIANEFLDALPIRQFVRRGGTWVERWVRDGAFAEQPAALAEEAADDAVLERSDAARDVVASLASRVAQHGGAALLLDYGAAEAGPADTLQALRDGAPADPLQQPGDADLTAHVDFGALREAAEAAGAAVHGPVPQGLFLARLGLFQRTDRLAQGVPPSRASALIEAARRLAEPAGMGRLFKAMAVAHPALGVPAGFEP